MSLTNHSIGILASRILGLYALITAVGYIPPMGSLPSAFVLTGFFLYAGLAYILLFQASRVATFLMKETSSTEHTSSLTIDQVTAAAFMVIGLLLVAKAIPHLVGTVVMRPLADLTAGRFLASLIQQTIEIALGVWLMFGAKGISNMIQRLRS